MLYLYACYNVTLVQQCAVLLELDSSMLSCSLFDNVTFFVDSNNYNMRMVQIK